MTRRSNTTSRPRRRAPMTAAAYFLAGVAAVASLLTAAHAQATLTLGTSIGAAGTSVSHVLSPSYFGIGIEPSNLFAFLGTTSPNTFSLKLLNNIANYTGQPMHVRIGGNTLDTALYNSSYNGYYFQSNPQTTGPTDISYFGPNFFSVINYLPKNTPVTYSIGMAYQGSNAESMAVTIAQSVVNALTNVKLSGFEIGNEPDLYVQNQFRSSGWGVSQYGSEWITRAQDIYNQVLQPKGISQTFFEAACTATTAANRGFRIQDLVTTGVATDNGVWLAGWNQHDYYYYVGVSQYTLSIEQLMNLDSTSGQFTEWASQVAQANVTGKPYYLREMGSVGPGGINGISNTFANAIWTINFLLYASTLGIQSVQLHVLQESYSAPWHPVQSSEGGKFVRPTYYAYAATAQIIGAGCQTQIAGLQMNNVPSQYSNYIGAYSVYDAGSLQSIVAINSKPMYIGQSGSSQTFTFTLDSSMTGKTFYLSTLTASGIDSTSNVTWNGMSYENSGDGSSTSVGGSSATQQVTVGSGGQLSFSVRDSQVVVANLGSQIGTQNNVVDAKACGTLQSTEDPSSSSNGDHTFKATSGFASDLPLSLGAIIGIGAGGGVAILLLLALCIFCCVRRSRRKRRQRAADTAALLKSDMRSSKNPRGPYRDSAYQAKRSAYRSVPLNDASSHDSSEDIFMSNMGRRYAHTPQGSIGSYPASLASSPMMAGTPRQTYDHYGAGGYEPTGHNSSREMASVTSTPPSSYAHGSHVRQPSNLNPYQPAGVPSQNRNISANTTAAAAGMGAGAGGAILARQQQANFSPSHEGRPQGPAGPRGPPPMHYSPRLRRNSLPGQRDRSPGTVPVKPTSSSAHGHGNEYGRRQRYSEQPPAPPVPALPPSFSSVPRDLNYGDRPPQGTSRGIQQQMTPQGTPTPQQQQQRQFPQQQPQQRGPPLSGARLGRPIRLSQDGRGDSPQRRVSSQPPRASSHLGHGGQ